MPGGNMSLRVAKIYWFEYSCFLMLFRFAVAEEDHVSLRGLAQSPRVHSSESHTGNNLPFLFTRFFGLIINYYNVFINQKLNCRTFFLLKIQILSV